MSVISVNPSLNGRQGRQSVDATSYDRTYIVLTDSPLTGQQQVLADERLPQFLTPYVFDNEVDSFAFARTRVAIQRADAPKVWDVTITFENIPQDEDVVSGGPLIEPPKYRLGVAKFTRIAAQDISEKPICSSAGEIFDPAVEVDDSRPVLTVIRNEPVIPAVNAFEYQDAVNSDTWFGVPPGYAKVDNISAEPKVGTVATAATRYTINYFEVTYDIHFNRRGWQKRILDQGLWELTVNDQGEKERVLIKDPETGNPIPKPVPLNGQGFVLVPGFENPVYLPFKVYRELPFAGLGI